MGTRKTEIAMGDCIKSYLGRMKKKSNIYQELETADRECSEYEKRGIKVQRKGHYDQLIPDDSDAKKRTTR